MTLYLYVPYVLENGPAFYSPILKQDEDTLNKFWIFSLSEDNISALMLAMGEDGKSRWVPCNYYPDAIELDKEINVREWGCESGPGDCG